MKLTNRQAQMLVAILQSSLEKRYCENLIYAVEDRGLLFETIIEQQGEELKDLAKGENNETD